MLGQADKKIYLNITEGKVVRRTERGVLKYDYVEGELERIYPREREFRGEKVPYWYIDLKDKETGDIYSLGLRSSSGVWRSLILSLGSAKHFLLPVRIAPYRKGEYDRVSVYLGEDRLDWISDLPPVEEVEVNGQRVKTTTKRDEYILSLVEGVNRLVSGSDERPTPQPTPETPQPTRRERRQRKSIGLSISSLTKEE